MSNNNPPNRTDLHKGARYMFLLQNGCIAVSTAFAAVLLVWVLPKDDSNADWDEGTYKQVSVGLGHGALLCSAGVDQCWCQLGHGTLPSLVGVGAP